jgi:hypothetical protein
MEALADGARLALSAVFVFAIAEKISSLRAHAAGWHPVMLAGGARRRRHATALMRAALVADLAAIALLVAQPRVGAAVSLLVFAVYTVAGIGAHSAGDRVDCRCLLGLLNSSTVAGLLARNSAFGACAALVAIDSPGRPSGAGAGVALAILVAIALCVAAVDRRTIPAPRFELAISLRNASQASPTPQPNPDMERATW